MTRTELLLDYYELVIQCILMDAYGIATLPQPMSVRWKAPTAGPCARRARRIN